MFAIAFGGRYKVTPNTSILFDYSQPLSSFDAYDPEPGFSLGVEFGTSAHAFQLFKSRTGKKQRSWTIWLSKL